MEPTPPPAPRGPLLPTLSTAVLLAMAAIGVVVLAAIFGFILFVASGLSSDGRLWWTGFASMIFALAFFLLYAATHDRKLARPLAWGFFVIGARRFYRSIFTGAGHGVRRLLDLTRLSVLAGLGLGA